MVLGHSGNFDGDAVLDLLQQPQTAEFITTKLWKEFISPVPEAREVKRFAAGQRRSGYEISCCPCDAHVRCIYAPQYRGTLVKSPTELVVGTLQLFRWQANDLRPAALTVAYLGQNLFSPPNVRAGRVAMPGSTVRLCSAARTFSIGCFLNPHRSEANSKEQINPCRLRLRC
jgi:uncharacterized protein (DUF1800 family)